MYISAIFKELPSACIFVKFPVYVVTSIISLVKKEYALFYKFYSIKQSRYWSLRCLVALKMKFCN